MRCDHLLEPAFRAAAARCTGLRLVDVHTHIGRNDPHARPLDAGTLAAELARIDATAAVFPLREPAGYPAANDAVLAAAERSDGRLVAFCRVDPRAGAAAEAERCLARGARGIKLHPHAERFDLTHPGVAPVFALAAEARIPVLVHAGTNIAPLGPHVLELCAAHPGARVILAHAAVSDGEWLWARAGDCPNLFFDLSWWDPATTLAILGRVAPGRLLHASDAPYGTPMAGALCTLRCCADAGLDQDQIAGVMGGQAERLLAGAPTLHLGPPPPPRPPGGGGVLARELGVALVQLFKGADARAAIAAAAAVASAQGAPEIEALLAAAAAPSLDRFAAVDLLIVSRALALTTTNRKAGT